MEVRVIFMVRKARSTLKHFASQGSVSLLSANKHALAFFFVLAAIVVGVSVSSKTYAQEELALFLKPSATRAYELGNIHLDSTTAAEYDIERAGALYRRALTLDATLPYVRHQLSRVEFLRGNSALALKLVNQEISLRGNTVSPSSYYVRGLILGYMDRFEESAASYELYLRTDSTNWAAINDYAWVLLKADRPHDALISIDWGLISWPENPWLLNSRATALYELGDIDAAYESILLANHEVTSLSEREWLEAYPGNDPLIAAAGVAVFKEAVQENMHTISLARENGEKDMQ